MYDDEKGGFRPALFRLLAEPGSGVAWLMQKVIVDTTGALYAAGQLSVGLRLGFNGVLLLRKPAAIHRGVCPVLRRLGRGRLSGRPFVARVDSTFDRPDGCVPRRC